MEHVRKLMIWGDKVKMAILRGVKFLGDSLERNVSLVALFVVCVALVRSGVVLGAYELIVLLFVPVVAMTFTFRFVRLITLPAEKAVQTWLKITKTN